SRRIRTPVSEDPTKTAPGYSQLLAFMAITVYFIDKDWNYREILLGFKPLHGPYIGNNLSDVLHRLLEE
ncbi:hypothetical protein N7501_009520, partial [Penicillium viridicatum]